MVWVNPPNRPAL